MARAGAQPRGVLLAQAPDAATFDDTIDYPLENPSSMERAIALSMLRGSVWSFAARHGHVQKDAVRPEGWQDEFAGDVYRFARVKGFSRDEAAEVERSMREKYGAVEKGYGSVRAMGDLDKSVAETQETNLGQFMGIPIGAPKRKRKRSQGALMEEPSHTSKQARLSVEVEAAEADTRPLKKRKAAKKSGSNTQRKASSSPEVDTGRRSRSTSLGELGPVGDSPWQPLSARKPSPVKWSLPKKHEASNASVRPVFSVDMDEAENSTEREDDRPMFTVDMADNDRPAPLLESNGQVEEEEEIIVSEESSSEGEHENESGSESEMVDRAGDALEAERARGIFRVGSPFREGSALAVEDERPSFAVDWGSPAPQSDAANPDTALAFAGAPMKPSASPASSRSFSPSSISTESSISSHSSSPLSPIVEGTRGKRQTLVMPATVAKLDSPKKRKRSLDGVSRSTGANGEAQHATSQVSERDPVTTIKPTEAMRRAGLKRFNVGGRSRTTDSSSGSGAESVPVPPAKDVMKAQPKPILKRFNVGGRSRTSNSSLSSGADANSMSSAQDAPEAQPKPTLKRFSIGGKERKQPSVVEPVAEPPEPPHEEIPAVAMSPPKKEKGKKRTASVKSVVSQTQPATQAETVGDANQPPKKAKQKKNSHASEAVDPVQPAPRADIAVDADQPPKEKKSKDRTMSDRRRRKQERKELARAQSEASVATPVFKAQQGEPMPMALDKVFVNMAQSSPQRESLDEPMPKDLERVFLNVVEIRPTSPEPLDEPMPKDLERIFINLVETKPTSPEPLDEPMPKDLERIFMNLVETKPMSPPCRVYQDAAVQTSPKPSPKPAPAQMPIVSQSSTRSKPSQQPSPTETHSSDSLRNMSFEGGASEQSSKKRSLPATPRTPPTSTAPDAQQWQGNSHHTKTATGKLKRVKLTRLPPPHTVPLGLGARRHRERSSDEWSVAETEPYVSPDKSAPRSAIERAETQPEEPGPMDIGPLSSPELGSKFVSADPLQDDLMEAVDIADSNGADDRAESPSPRVRDSQRVIPESYDEAEAIQAQLADSQMAVGGFDPSGDDAGLPAEDLKDQTSDQESDDDIPHHLSQDPDEMDDDVSDPEDEASANEDESEAEHSSSSHRKAHRASSLASSEATDEIQDMINTQLLDEMDFEVSQRLSAEQSSTILSRKGKEPETNMTKRTGAPASRAPTTTATTNVRRTEVTSPRRKTGTSSQHFSASSTAEPKSGLPFPSTDTEIFGLFQERYAKEPFWLLVATMLVNQTPGKRAIPVLEGLQCEYPTAAHLARADPRLLEASIRHLGLGEQRAGRLITLAKVWTRQPPKIGMRHKSKERGYPNKEAYKVASANGRTLLTSDAEDCGAFLEIGHLPGCGRYAFDSWRIFCRDVFRGVAQGYNGEGVAERAPGQGTFQPEWMRVLPTDKELKAYLRWMWLKEGFMWDWHTGDKAFARRDLLEAAQGGGAAIEKAIIAKFSRNRKGSKTTARGSSMMSSRPSEEPAAVASSSVASRIRRPAFAEFLADEIQDEEMPDAHADGGEGSSESARHPTETPMRRLGVNGRAMLSLRTYGKRRAQ